MPKVVYGCCVGSWEKAREYVWPRVQGRQFVAVFGYTSIAAAYNSIFDAYAPREFDALIIVHDDLEMIDPDTEKKVLAALTEPDVAVVGVAGSRTARSLAWWERDTLGHQRIDSHLIDFDEHSGDALLLEGSFLAFSRSAVVNLAFDEGYTGFHGYDCDISMQAFAFHKRAVVADITTHHHTSIGFKSAESHRSWLEADRLFREKWGL